MDLSQAHQERLNIYAVLYYIVMLFLICSSIYILASQDRKDNFALSLSEMSYRLGFKVNNFAINDVSNIKIADLITQVAIADKPILVLDLEKIRSEVESNIWVKEAVVERVLPDKIRILIDEHNPRAIWQSSDSFYVIDELGEAIKNIDKDEIGEHQDLIVVTGEDARFNLAEMFEFLDYEDQVKRDIKGAVYVNERRWDVIMINDMIVKLPSRNPLQAWKYFVSLNDELDLTNNNVISIDLRAPDLLFLELDPDSAANQKLLRVRN